MSLKEAKQYIGFGIKEGVWEAEQFEGWTDEQLIKFAQDEGDRGDYYANTKEET